jgi:alpha-mannosidase
MLEASKRMDKGIIGIPKVRQAFSRKYFDELCDRVSNNPRLQTWEGELYFEYHRGTLTSMARNKRSNRKAEFKLMDLELLSVLAEKQLPQEDIEYAWKTVLMNQFHDILPGTSIHEVYEVTKKEYEAIDENLSGHISGLLDDLTSGSEGLTVSNTGGNESITVFNTTGFDRDDIVLLGDCKANALTDPDGEVYPVQQTANGSIAYLRNIPSKGWRTFAASVEKQAGNVITVSVEKQTGNVITSSKKAQTSKTFTLTGIDQLETPFYFVCFDKNGSISRIFDKENNREVLQDNKPTNLMRMYEDKPIYYDNWDIDIFYTEKSWDVLQLSRLEWTETGPVRATLELERKISNSTICQKIHFYADSRRIDFDTTVDWKESQHLLKVHFPVNIHTDEATFDIQFGNITRKTHSNTSWDIARFESCGQKWVDLSEGHYGVSLLNDCKYGHSVKDSDIGLTLIKSGIEPNPVTDQEVHIFTYSLYPHKGGWRDGGTVKQSYFLNQPTLVKRGGAELDTFSLVSANVDNVVIETIKPAEDGDGIIVRLYECDNSLTQAKLNWNRPFSAVEECDLLEDKTGDVVFDGDEICFTIKPFEIKTYRFCD